MTLPAVFSQKWPHLLLKVDISPERSDKNGSHGQQQHIPAVHGGLPQQLQIKCRLSGPAS
jgi:hypothetical protein